MDLNVNLVVLLVTTTLRCVAFRCVAHLESRVEVADQLALVVLDDEGIDEHGHAGHE